MIKIILKDGKEAPLLRQHLWVFSGAIKKIIHKKNNSKSFLSDGDLVDVLDIKNNFLGRGFFNNGSIAVRIISFLPLEINIKFWESKILEALQLRATLGLINNNYTNIFRLIHGEGDGLSGLIIDTYANHFVIQCHNIGMHKHIKEISRALKNCFLDVPINIYDKSVESLPKEYAQSISNQYLLQEILDTNPVAIENNHSFKINYHTGQKTGFFIDQRMNRDLLTLFVKNKNVLNTFCYSGGFSIYALKAGASSVTSIDYSSKAIELVNENVKFLKLQNQHTSLVSDTFDYLTNENISFYDVIILDPPAFAKHIKVKNNAIQAYKRLNNLAIKKIKKGGIIFTFSCSQVIDKELFYNTITSAAIGSGKNVSVLHQLGQSPDHPINIYHPESNYLKGLVLYVY